MEMRNSPIATPREINKTEIPPPQTSKATKNLTRLSLLLGFV